MRTKRLTPEQQLDVRIMFLQDHREQLSYLLYLDAARKITPRMLRSRIDKIATSLFEGGAERGMGQDERSRRTRKITRQ